MPSCETWHELSDAEVVATDVVNIVATVIGFIAGVAVIVVSVISHDRM